MHIRLCQTRGAVEIFFSVTPLTSLRSRYRTSCSDPAPTNTMVPRT